ncbi:hypothetical protein AAFF_G00041210 [Aldrovandia affinis]|uniref:Uncharacterized protein n=1 Tax=Aldrovandia affinis TaxID=143900 RepID=A0AAD7WF34_9TELE|nr:hypothetical protein AAFF_G00041210 [Aldrovandia affinis]
MEGRAGTHAAIRGTALCHRIASQEEATCHPALAFLFRSAPLSGFSTSSYSQRPQSAPADNSGSDRRASVPPPAFAPRICPSAPMTPECGPPAASQSPRAQSLPLCSWLPDRQRLRLHNA